MNSSVEQLAMFADMPQVKADVLQVTDEQVAAIAASGLRRTVTDRTPSDAALDQGFAPIERVARRTRRQLELYGPGMGRNTQFNQPPSNKEIFGGLSRETKDELIARFIAGKTEHFDPMFVKNTEQRSQTEGPLVALGSGAVHLSEQQPNNEPTITVKQDWRQVASQWADGSVPGRSI